MWPDRMNPTPSNFAVKRTASLHSLAAAAHRGVRAHIDDLRDEAVLVSRMKNAMHTVAVGWFCLFSMLVSRP